MIDIAYTSDIPETTGEIRTKTED